MAQVGYFSALVLTLVNAFFVLDLSFDPFNGVGRFDIQSDRLARERLYKDLHTHC